MTNDDWINYHWIEVTGIEDKERNFIRGYARTPEEKAEMISKLAPLVSYEGAK